MFFYVRMDPPVIIILVVSFFFYYRKQILLVKILNYKINIQKHKMLYNLYIHHILKSTT